MAHQALSTCCTPGRPERPPIDSHRFSAICKALAHPARVHIVAYLKQINRCLCGQIVDSLPLAQSTVSQHLKILKACGLVRGEIEGPRTCYCLDHQVLAEFKTLTERL